MPGNVKDLKVWQEAVALSSEVVRAIQKGARRETMAFTDTVLHSAASVATLIAQGAGCYGPQDQRRLYTQARLALLELETLLVVARQSGLISAAILSMLTGRVASVSRLLGGYLGYLERHMDESEAAAAAVAARLLGTADLRATRVDRKVNEAPATP